MKIYFVGKKYNHLFFVIDIEDYDSVSQHKWYYKEGKRSNTYYAQTAIKNEKGLWKTVCLGRFLLELKKEDPRQADHKDGNGWNNCRHNLRITTGSQNQMNAKQGGGTSKYKGVCFHKYHQKWMAYFSKNKKRFHIGYFKSETSAAQAYNDMTTVHFGKYARLNKTSHGK